jgi:hypothetical protein
VETPVQENVQLREERVRVQRNAVDRPASEADLQGFREGEIELTETAEEAVVSTEVLKPLFPSDESWLFSGGLPLAFFGRQSDSTKYVR